MFDGAKGLTTPVSSVELNDHDNSQISPIPCIIHFPDNHPIVVSEELKDALLSFKAKFEKPSSKNTQGRAQRGFNGDVEATVVTHFHKALIDPSLLVAPKETQDDLASSLKPVAFGVAKSQETSARESGMLANFRLGFEGRREILCTELLPLVQFMESQGEKGGTPPQKVYHFVKTWTPQSLGEFLKWGGVVYNVTVGPSECLFTPTGFVFAERIHRTGDAYGVKLCPGCRNAIPVPREAAEAALRNVNHDVL